MPTEYFKKILINVKNILNDEYGKTKRMSSIYLLNASAFDFYNSKYFRKRNTMAVFIVVKRFVMMCNQ